MSRIGRKVIPIPEKVEIFTSKEDLRVKGPKGELSQKLKDGIEIEVTKTELKVHRRSDSKTMKALHGLYRSLIYNMVQGVTEGFEKRLILSGVGYRAFLEKESIRFSLGYSHTIEFSIPQGIQCKVEDNNTQVQIQGISKELVGETAARIRKLRPPEPYKKKGIRYHDEVVRTKAGKSGKK